LGAHHRVYFATGCSIYHADCNPNAPWDDIYPLHAIAIPHLLDQTSEVHLYPWYRIATPNFYSNQGNDGPLNQGLFLLNPISRKNKTAAK
jgi:hypothetical protein